MTVGVLLKHGMRDSGCLSLRAVPIKENLIRSRGKCASLRKNTCFIKEYEDSIHQNNISVKIDNQTCNVL